MKRRQKLLEVHKILTAAIRAAETWEKSYTDSPATFKRLVREEAALQASATEYLLGLSDRIPMIVNWAEVPLKPVYASAVPPESDEAWKAERAFLASLLSPHILELMVIGANAGEDLYSRPLGINTLDEQVINAADKYTAELVSDVTSTTRRYIQQSIRHSIELGEDVTTAIERIRQRVANPVRAEMIARTESVTAYQTGLEHFGEQSGALSSTWDALSGACALCAPLNGVTKKLGQPFTLGNGKAVSRPPGHVSCRCGRILNYPDNH